jgi:hypothetical protein
LAKIVLAQYQQRGINRGCARAQNVGAKCQGQPCNTQEPFQGFISIQHSFEQLSMLLVRVLSTGCTRKTSRQVAKFTISGFAENR